MTGMTEGMFRSVERHEYLVLDPVCKPLYFEELRSVNFWGRKCVKTALFSSAQCAVPPLPLSRLT